MIESQISDFIIYCRSEQTQVTHGLICYYGLLPATKICVQNFNVINGWIQKVLKRKIMQKSLKLHRCVGKILPGIHQRCMPELRKITSLHELENIYDVDERVV